MTYSKNWNLVDVFTVAQVAYLWGDRDPPDNNVNEIYAGGRPPEVSAIVQVLQGAIEGNQLTATWHDQVAKIAKDCFKVSVSRENLINFARAKKQFPSFLFDTIGPELAKEGAVADPSPAHKEIEAKNQGGRPAKYDWDGCYAEIVRIADIDGLPSVQNNLIEQLRNWFIAEIDDHPADSEIKKRVSAIYKRLKESGWKPRNG